jgi:hypothetical protein
MMKKLLHAINLKHIYKTLRGIACPFTHACPHGNMSIHIIIKREREKWKEVLKLCITLSSVQNVMLS